MLPRLFLLFLPALLAAAPAAQAVDDEGIGFLIRGGALELALKRLDEEQSRSTAEQWPLLERRRLELYAERGQWDQLSQRVDGIPPDVPEDFHRWARQQAALARLAAGDAPGARRYLRGLLWRSALSDSESAALRRLVIRSYLAEDNLADAQTSLLRYTLDYKAKGDAWQVLHADILLRAGDDKGAFEVLTGAESADARLLRGLAGLRAGLYKPATALNEATRLVAGFKQQPTSLRRAYVLQARAAAIVGNHASRVLALEAALALPAPQQERYFLVTADELWQAYDHLAEGIGNDAKLLMGNDAAWLAKGKVLATKESHKARALYAFLAHKAGEEGTRTKANRLLAESLLKDGRAETLRALYIKSSRIAGPVAVPAPVRYRLAEIALAQFDMRLAAVLMKGLDEPPEGEDADLWTMRRARTLVYVGEVVTAQTLLATLLDAHNPVDPELARHFLQVVFDLQTLGRHTEALALLEQLSERVTSKSLQRELLFWRADSHAALGQNAEAGELYLRSAVFTGNGEDPWGQTARFYAAGVLMRAGMTDDARHIYAALLRVTSDSARRAQIERQMQQLWLNTPLTTP